MKEKKFKRGAASFYVVAFSTLILLIIAASFTALVVAQITRSSNADLAQSAYDSALAGVEDAKLAYYSYSNCVAMQKNAIAPTENGEIGCEQIVYLMEKSGEECDTVARVIGRTIDENGAVSVNESTENDLSQEYTCVKVNMTPENYEGSFQSGEQVKVVRPKFKDTPAKDIDSIRISWGSVGDIKPSAPYFSQNQMFFPSSNSMYPPVISVALVQAGGQFYLEDFNRVTENGTDRGMVYLVPSIGEGNLSNNPDSNYTKVAVGSKISKKDVIKSNDKTKVNKPFVVVCDDHYDKGYLCEATIELPDVVDGTDRSDDNFVIAVASPYGISTGFSLEFLKKDEGYNDVPVPLDHTQIGVDSTGRANDLYRRVETRLERQDDSLMSIMGPLELFGENSGGNGGGSGNALEKDLRVVCEWDFAANQNSLPGCSSTGS